MRSVERKVRTRLRIIAPDARSAVLAKIAATASTPAKTLPPRLLLVGDGGVACHEFGEVLGVCVEVPIPRVSVTAREYYLGGVCGIASLLGFWGAEPVASHPRGRGHISALMSETLTKGGVRGVALRTGLPQRAGYTRRVFAGGHQLAHIEEEEMISAASSAAVARSAASLFAVLRGSDLLVVVDKDGAGLDSDFAGGLCARARAAGVPVFYEPRSLRFPEKGTCDVVKMNQNQIREWFGTAGESEREADDAARKALDRTGARCVVLTRGGRGILVRRRARGVDETFVVLPEPRRLYDLVSAGDIVTAGLTYCIATGFSFLESACFAATAAELSLDRRHDKAIELKDIFSYHKGTR